MRLTSSKFVGGRLFIEGDVADPGAGGSPGGGGDVEKPKDVNAEILQGIVAAQQQMAGTLREVSEGLQAIRASAVSRGEKPKDDDVVTDEQFDVAVRDGDAATQRRYHDFRQRKLERDTIDPLRAFGLDSIANLTRATVLETKPHYKRFEKEISTFLGNMDPATRANAHIQEMAYQTIVGKHHEELTKEATEAALRQATQNPGNAGAPGGGGSGRGTGGGGGEAVKSVAELLGTAEADALAFRGMSEDQFAQKMGYKDWAAYAKLIQEQDAAKP